MTEQEQIEKNLSEAFHLMYDGLPEPVQLCHKTYRVVAVNPAGAAFGRLPGHICAQGCSSLKAGLCRQAQMRKAGVTTWCYAEKTEDAPRMITFWIPVAGNPDYYVHFGIGVTIDYAARPTEEQVYTHGIAETGETHMETNTVYQFTVKGRNGEDVSLADYKGKVLLIVNTATRCGFTPQYEGLEWMYDQHKELGFEILDFPCNQFGQHAPGTDDEIHTFCVLHYKTAFPRFAKVDVNGDNAAPLFRFLTQNAKFEGFPQDGKFAAVLEKMLGDADSDYAKKPSIKWNFTKFLIGRDGRIVRRFEPTAPLSDINAEVEKALR